LCRDIFAGNTFGGFMSDNINTLLRLLKSRLHSAGKAKSTDAMGNVVYVDCDIFSNDMLVDFLDLSLSEFNQCPKFTNFSFDNTPFVNTFSAILVEGATMYALASKALIERGREFFISDDGLNFNPPSVSELMNTQYQNLLQDHAEKLRRIKDAIVDFED
jgi:hypothetical protein